MDSPKQGSNYVSEQVQKAFSGASKEANKEPGKDPKGSWGTKHPSATEDALGDETQDSKDDGNNEADKQ